MAEVQASAPYLVGALLALATTFLYYGLLNGWIGSLLYALTQTSGRANTPMLMFHFFGLISQSVTPIIFLAAIFIPACLLAANLIDRRASFSVLLSQEYAPFASGALYGWAMAHLLMLIPALVVMQLNSAPARGVLLGLRFAPLLLFVLLFLIALRVILRLTYGRAIAVMMMACASFILLPLIPRLLPWLTSPFLLIIVFFILRNFFNDIITTQRARENFQQNLHAATLNPADASAHYNLGLIHQQRGQYEEAKARFQRAIEIDDDEIDAHYQLGRIARQELQLAEAIKHFDAVVTRNPQHSLHEVWREIGRAYLQANQLDDARFAFEQFLEKRPSDAEALYHYGLTLAKLGQNERAAAQMRAVIEAVSTSPSYKQRRERRWLKEAEGFLKQP
ncbi:MAG: tetratricopeptide repeat protein [Acidobacteria bacterium]|nr:tetratricopeptide repeat protein [Acidobacteriota bacterium]